MRESAAKPIELHGVSVIGSDERGDAVTRLEDVRLSVAPGEWLYIVGVNGSGKSTLARVLAGLYTEGMIGDYRRGFAGSNVSPIVLQHPQAQLFGETPREEIQFALEWQRKPADEIGVAAERVLDRVGLLALADEPWHRLSGGQLQLTAFAAAIAGEAPLIVLDEATSMLDERTRVTIVKESRRLQRQGTSIVWVTQRLDELEPESRVITVSEGRIVFDGDVRQMLYGEDEEAITPCEQAGLRMPYLPAMALQLRRQDQLKDPLPVTAEEWRRVLGDVADGEWAGTGGKSTGRAMH
ncbi:energy-coupling factor ABC transporter ATP-binding protein [Cohnella panacarvi]|uniref:energy-coupling factor ABC transporter ATP-binding protein n=1 Tax=Cohnella panacarvi TaxID=400776 RepID=UPI00047CF778|nr:ABC transporter ATP-binding protein [Cohnella panacarvi]